MGHVDYRAHDLRQCALVPAFLSATARIIADNVFVPVQCRFPVRFAVLRSLILNALRPYCDRMSWQLWRRAVWKLLDNHFQLAVTFAPETLSMVA
jgi:hypothetical protein